MAMAWGPVDVGKRLRQASSGGGAPPDSSPRLSQGCCQLTAYSSRGLRSPRPASSRQPACLFFK